MLAALSYTGVAMFEFRQNFADGASVLLEVNARFWGSLPLPLSIGMDFPHDLLRLLSGESVAPRSYRPGIYARNLIADAYATGQRIPKTAGSAKKALAAFREILVAVPRMISGRERSDTFVRDDLSPGFTEIAQVARTVISRMARALARSLPGATALRQRRIRGALEKCHADARIVFLCQGNICRSPFAEHLLARELVGQSAKLSVTSVGLLPAPGRRCPEQAVRAALDRGIDLKGHVSRFLDDSGLSGVGLVFVFDRLTLEDFRDRFPAAAPPVFLLAGLLDGVDIEDPLGRGPGFFADAFGRIERAVGELVRIVRSSCT
jgi:protein-tyrosine-phosphatase